MIELIIFFKKIDIIEYDYLCLNFYYKEYFIYSFRSGYLGMFLEYDIEKHIKK